MAKNQKKFYKLIIEDILYREQTNGVSFMEMFTIKNYLRCAFAAIVMFLKFNLYNDMLMFYSGNDSFAFLKIVSCFVCAQILIGAIIKRCLKGRKVKFFFGLTLFSIPFDLAVIYLRFAQMGGPFAQTITFLSSFIVFS